MGKGAVVTAKNGCRFSSAPKKKINLWFALDCICSYHGFNEALQVDFQVKYFLLDKLAKKNLSFVPRYQSTQFRECQATIKHSKQFWDN